MNNDYEIETEEFEEDEGLSAEQKMRLMAAMFVLEAVDLWKKNNEGDYHEPL